MLISSSDHHDDRTVSTLLDLPSEILEILFSFIPFKESFNFRVSHRQVLSSFLNYFRRWFRDRLSIYNEHMIDKFEIIDCDDEYRERYQQEFERVENQFNCKIPFILKEILMMTKRYDEEMDCDYSFNSYPVNWFNPIKLWKKNENLVDISDGIALIPNGKYNNLIIANGDYISKLDIWESLCRPFSTLFNISDNSFQKHCEIACNRNLLNRLSAVTSVPLALCLFKHFTAIDISPRQIAKMLSVISPKLYSDRDFLVKAAKIYYKIGKEIPQNLLDDRNFCLRLVKSHGKMLKYCTKFLQDKDIVTQAVKQNGFAIKYISSHFLRSNQYLLELAISSKPYSLDYIPNSVPGFRKLALKAIKGIENLGIIPKFVNQDELLQDKEIAEALLMKCPQLIEQMPNLWKECRPLAKKLFSFHPESIILFSKKVSQDPRIVEMIVNTKPSILGHMQQDINILSSLLKVWNLPSFTYGNYDENMEKILELARRTPDIYSLVLMTSNFFTYCDTLEKKKKWIFTFLKEGLSHNSEIIAYHNIRAELSNFNSQQKEEILQCILVNPRPGMGSYHFNLFSIDLLTKYLLEAYKKGCRPSDTLPLLLTDPDDIVECITRNTDHRLLCLTKKSYDTKKLSYSYY